MASGSDEEEKEKSQQKVKTKKMAIRQGVNFSSIHGGPSKEKLIEKRHLEENVSISKRVKDVKHSEVTHVKGKSLVSESEIPPNHVRPHPRITARLDFRLL